MNKKTLILLIYSILIFVNIFAQNKDKKDNQFEEVNVIAPYEPTISDAFKINDNPVIEDTVVALPKLSYTIEPRKIETNFQVDPIKPAKVVAEPVSKLYKGYVKLGFGNYKSPLGEVSFNSLRSKESNWGLNYRHLSANPSISDYAQNSYSDNEANVFGKKFFKEHTLYGNIGFKRNGLNYYGFKPADYPAFNYSNNDLNQHYSVFDINTSFSSGYLDSSKLHHAVKFNFYTLSDNYKSSENSIKFSAEINKSMSSKKYEITHFISLSTDIDYSNYNNKLYNQDFSIIKLLPQYHGDFDQFRLNLGLNTCIGSDTSTKVNLYPAIDLSAYIVKNILTAYLGLSGDQKKNSFRKISDENPFVSSSVPLMFTDEKFKIYGGLKGTISSFVSYNFSLSHSEIDNMPFFISENTIPYNKFTIVYDNITLLNVNGQIGAYFSENAKVLINYNFYQYQMQKLKKPWHKPDMDLTFSINYDIKHKVIIETNVFAIGQKYAYVPTDGSNKTLLGIVDFNFGIEYRYTKLLSFFFNFNNVENQSYERWLNYPTQKFGFIGGLTYSF